MGGNESSLDDSAGRASTPTPDALSASSTPAPVRTAGHQLSAHMVGPHDHEEQRLGRTRAADRAVREEKAKEIVGAEETKGGSSSNRSRAL